MEEYKEMKLYILIEWCCRHFNGLYVEDALPELADEWFGDEGFVFDTVENLNKEFEKIGYTLSEYTV